MRVRLWIDARVGVCQRCQLERYQRRHDHQCLTAPASAVKLLRRLHTAEAALEYLADLPGLAGVRIALRDEDADWWARQDAVLLREWRATHGA